MWLRCGSEPLVCWASSLGMLQVPRTIVQITVVVVFSMRRILSIAAVGVSKSQPNWKFQFSQLLEMLQTGS